MADELLKETSELRRPSASKESTCRTSNTTGGRSSQGADSTGGGIVSVIGYFKNILKLITRTFIKKKVEAIPKIQ